MEKNTIRVMLIIALACILAGCLYLALCGMQKPYHVPLENTTAGPEAYFCPQDSCMDILLNLTVTSKNVDCAFYDLGLEPLISAFEAKGPGVRLVMDHDNYYKDEDELGGLSDRIKVAVPNHQMHDKFCVFDRRIVATGSFNPTERGNFENNNNLVIIESAYLAKNFEDEFDEMWKGIYSGGNEVEYPLISVNGSYVGNYFCPEDCSPELFTRLIDDARQSVYFMAFSFTRDDIGDSLMAARRRGVEVRGVMERSQESRWSEYERLKDAGIDVRLDSNPANMHHKVFIIDGSIVITGSANPTGNGIYHNDENILVLYDTRLAREFTQEFWSVYNQNLNK